MNLNRGKWDKALQIETDAQFIFNSIIYESFIQLGYAGEPHRSLSSKYLLARRRENIFTITCGWKHYIPWKILAHCWDLSRGENTLAKGIEEGFMGEQTVDVSLDMWVRFTYWKMKWGIWKKTLGESLCLHSLVMCFVWDWLYFRFRHEL